MALLFGLGCIGLAVASLSPAAQFGNSSRWHRVIDVGLCSRRGRRDGYGAGSAGATGAAGVMTGAGRYRSRRWQTAFVRHRLHGGGSPLAADWRSSVTVGTFRSQDSLIALAYELRAPGGPHRATAYPIQPDHDEAGSASTGVASRRRVVLRPLAAAARPCELSPSAPFRRAALSGQMAAAESQHRAAAVFSTARSVLNAAVASGSTVPQVFSNVSTSRRTRIRRVAASTLLSSIATMPLRKLWQVVSAEKLAR